MGRVEVCLSGPLNTKLRCPLMMHEKHIMEVRWAGYFGVEWR